MSTRSPLRKRIADITDLLNREAADTEELLGGVAVGGSGRSQSRGKSQTRQKSPAPGKGGRGECPAVPAWSPAASSVSARTPAVVSTSPRCRARELADLIQQLNQQMLGAARELQFEVAARLRDEIGELKKELRGMDAAGVGQ